MGCSSTGRVERLERTDCEAAVDALYEAFAGFGAAPEMTLDWTVGADLRGSSVLFEPLTVLRDGSYIDLPERDKALRFLMRWAFHLCHAYGAVFAVRDPADSTRLAAVICCMAPGQVENFKTVFQTWRRTGLPPWEGPARSKSWQRMKTRVDTLLSAMKTLERKHAPGPHWKVHTFGVRPSMQKMGLGRQLLSTISDTADSQQVPVYLECSGARNECIYRKFGFETRQKYPLVPAGEDAGRPFDQNGGVCAMVRPVGGNKR